MPELDIIQRILHNRKYNLSIFLSNEIKVLQNVLFTKEVRGKETLFVNCIMREKDIQLKLEEVEKLDKNGHLIVHHDFHNHDGELPDGIFEAFIDWKKSEKLSFWNEWA